MSSSSDLKPSVLIADDQPDLIDALALLLKAEGMSMEATSSPEGVLAALRARQFDLLLMDLNYTADTTSGKEGLDLLSRIQLVDSMLPIVVMTGWGSVDVAVAAMRHGVRDFVEKPWDNAALAARLRSEIDQGRERRRKAGLARRELDEARRIQRALLPTGPPEIEGFEIASSWRPAAGVGGDCFDAIAFGTGRLALSIADVVGKGIPAALLMSNLQATCRAFATGATSPGDLCAQVNRILCGHIAEDRFITFFYCVADAAGSLTYANAGHYLPMLVRPDGTLERLAAGGPVLGVFPDGSYSQGQCEFGSGDRLVLFTDGITEARRAGDEEEFGEDRLQELVVAHRHQSVTDLHASLAEAVVAFTGGEFQDDATLIVLARRDECADE